MQRLLNLFTDDCAIYEPFGKGPQSHTNIREKTCLKADRTHVIDLHTSGIVTHAERGIEDN